MEEKSIVSGKPSLATIPLIPIIIGAVLIVLDFTGALGGTTHYSHGVKTGFTPEPISLIIGIALIILGIVLFIYSRNCEINVTEKRVYGKAAFGKQVDIPVDSISAVGTISLLKGVSVASASGAIKFLYISNSDEVYNALSKLIINRQDKTPIQTTVKQEIQQSNADELAKFKKLFDDGIISEEEFNAKKKQLLGL